MEEFDVIIVGAGLTGVNTAYRLRQLMPDQSFAVLEATDTIGGTWAFWKYPGARSDSALTVFGFPWHPWPHGTDFATAPQIRDYIEDAARVQGIDKEIRFRHRVARTAWSSAEQRWMLDVDVEGEDGQTTRRQIKCWWMIVCSGYYSYTKALEVEIPGIDRFQGRVAHPQWWTKDIDWAGKRVVIIGSGATVITLLPEIAATAAHTTMLQRSPSYVLGVPLRDPVSSFVDRWLPFQFFKTINWWRRMILENAFVAFCTYCPVAARKFVMGEMRRKLPKDCPADVHFSPRYGVFDQRLCFCLDDDFFKALHKPNCEVVTDTIDTVTETGIRLSSGKVLDADLIITATGLHLDLMNGNAPVVDGEPVPIGEHYIWRSCMIDGVPNTGSIIGYVKGVWTPGADARARMLIKVMKHMRAVGASSGMPYMSPAERAVAPSMGVVDISSTYFKAALDRLPRTTGKQPWVNGQNWFEDMRNVLFGSVTQGMKYTMKDDEKTA